MRERVEVEKGCERREGREGSGREERVKEKRIRSEQIGID